MPPSNGWGDPDVRPLRHPGSRVTGLEIALALAIGLVIGGVVGLLGAGGSILTVPALMLALGLTATQATGTSLVVVAIVAGVGAIGHGRAGRVDWRSGTVFAAVGVPAAVLGGRGSVLLSDVALTLILVGLLGVTAMWLWRREVPEVAPEPATWRRVVPAGIGLGVVTGMLGVGGGFMAVPALAGLVGLPLPVAIGTSQVVLVVNALAGLGGRVGSGSVQLVPGLILALGGTVGSFLSSRLVGRVSSDGLTRLLVGLLVLVSIALVVDLAI